MYKIVKLDTLEAVAVNYNIYGELGLKQVIKNSYFFRTYGEIIICSYNRPNSLWELIPKHLFEVIEC